MARRLVVLARKNNSDPPERANTGSVLDASTGQLATAPSPSRLHSDLAVLPLEHGPLTAERYVATALGPIPVGEAVATTTSPYDLELDKLAVESPSLEAGLESDQRASFKRPAARAGRLRGEKGEVETCALIPAMDAARGVVVVTGSASDSGEGLVGEGAPGCGEVNGRAIIAICSTH